MERLKTILNGSTKEDSRIRRDSAKIFATFLLVDSGAALILGNKELGQALAAASIVNTGEAVRQFINQIRRTTSMR